MRRSWRGNPTHGKHFPESWGLSHVPRSPGPRIRIISGLQPCPDRECPRVATPRAVRRELGYLFDKPIGGKPMRARTLAFLPVLSFVLVSCASIGGAIEDTSTGVRGFVSTTSDKIGGLFDRDEEAKALQATTINTYQPESDPAAVTTVQRLLADAGYSPGTADGIYGPKTRAAILSFQRKAGLTPDGLISEELVASLNAVEKSTVASLMRDDGSSALETGLR